MPSEMAQEIESRAESMGISTSNYCKIILRQWLESKQQLILEET